MAAVSRRILTDKKYRRAAERRSVGAPEPMLPQADFAYAVVTAARSRRNRSVADSFPSIYGR